MRQRYFLWWGTFGVVFGGAGIVAGYYTTMTTFTAGIFLLGSGISAIAVSTNQTFPIGSHTISWSILASLTYLLLVPILPLLYLPSVIAGSTSSVDILIAIFSVFLSLLLVLLAYNVYLSEDSL